MRSLRQSLEHNEALLAFIALFAALLLSSRYSFVLFHTLAELFSIVVAYSLFIIAWNSRRYLENGYLLLIGMGYLFAAALDLFHTMSYKGMGIFPAYDSNLPTQLWIAARYLQSLTLLAAPVYLRRRLHPHLAFGGYLVVTLLLCVTIFAGVFPVAYVEGVGLTAFKVVSEYIICLVYLAAIFVLVFRRSEFDASVGRLLILSITASLVSELAFTRYVGVYDSANLMGHLLKIIAFYLLYRAIIQTGFENPYNLLFRRLVQNEERLREARDQLAERVRERTAELLQANQDLKAEVSERRRAEAELQAYREHLEELVQARTLELQKEIGERQRAEAAVRTYAVELERRNSELQDFASSASHDMQEPLRKILAFGERLKELEKGNLSEQGLDYIYRMQNAAGRMQRMIEGLLSYSRVTTQAQPLEPVDLNGIAEEVLSDLEVRIESSHAQVEMERLPQIEADPLQMRQLLQNLIGNALKFHRPDQPPHVKVYYQQDGAGKVQIVVEDDGVGFDESQVGRLFQPFHRLHTRSQFEGSGIGLAVCRKIVERHGGSITARSAIGQGSSFIVTLPVRQKVAAKGSEFPV